MGENSSEYDRGWADAMNDASRQIEHYKRENERLKTALRITTEGGVAGVSLRAAQEIEELKAANENLNSELGELQALIKRFFNASMLEYEQWEEKFVAWMEPLKQAIEEAGQPAIVQVIAMVADNVIEVNAISFNRATEVMAHTPEKMYHYRLLQAQRIGQIAAVQQHAVDLIFNIALMLSDYIPLICDQLCRQGRTSQPINMKLIHKLEKWIDAQERFQSKKENLPTSPAKIAEALKLHGAFINSGGMSQLEFAVKNRGGDTKALQRAKAVYEILLNESHNMPKAIADFAQWVEDTGKQTGVIRPS